MSNPIKKLKEKPFNYIVGYLFFLLLGLVGASYQMIKYMKNELVLVSEDYWVNPELVLTALFMMWIFRPMALVDIIQYAFKGFTNKATRNDDK